MHLKRIKIQMSLLTSLQATQALCWNVDVLKVLYIEEITSLSFYKSWSFNLFIDSKTNENFKHWINNLILQLHNLDIWSRKFINDIFNFFFLSMMT